MVLYCAIIEKLNPNISNVRITSVKGLLMKRQTILHALLMIIILFSTACNLKPGTTPSSPPTPAGSPRPQSPLSLSELYQARLEAGGWTAGQGLIDLLGMYTGTTTADNAIGAQPVSDFELTGIMRLAADYLAANPNGQAHDDLQKQVNLLEAPIDRLDQFSRKVDLSAAFPHLASLGLPTQNNALSGDQAECQGLWADGFTSATPVICFEYGEQIVDGTSIRLYYPSWWAADDPNRTRLAPLMQAAVLAVGTFNAYGPDPLPATTMVVTELAGTDPDTSRRNADLLAMAVPVGNSPLNCYVGIFPSMFAKTTEQSQQALAHEMFHCYQYKNLAAQEHGPMRSATTWWVEGSAEYFSNVVYPAVNFEHRWLGDLTMSMMESNIFDWSYKCFIFFQYLENRPGVGTAGVLDLLRALPTTSGSGVDRQMAALSAYPNMDTLFHGFAEAVADQNVIDSDHTAIPLGIPFGDDIEEVTPGDIMGREPFSVDIRWIIFPQNFNYDMTIVITGLPGQVSARPENGPHVWGPVPSQVVSSCLETHYIVVETQTGSNPANTYEVLLRAESHPGTGMCSCLTGSWRMDNASYLANLNALIQQSAPGTINYTGAEGNVLVEFLSDGQITQQIDNLTVSADMNVSGMPVQNLVISMNGTTSSDFQELDGNLSYSNLQSQLTISTLLNGQSMGDSVPSDYLSAGPLGTGASYTCSENDLTLVPIYPNYHNLPALTFTREQP